MNEWMYNSISRRQIYKTNKRVKKLKKTGLKENGEDIDIMWYK